jgi:hypothetical protein
MRLAAHVEAVICGHVDQRAIRDTRLIDLIE